MVMQSEALLNQRVALEAELELREETNKNRLVTVLFPCVRRIHSYLSRIGLQVHRRASQCTDKREKHKYAAFRQD